MRRVRAQDRQTCPARHNPHSSRSALCSAMPAQIRGIPHSHALPVSPSLAVSGEFGSSLPSGTGDGGRGGATNTTRSFVCLCQGAPGSKFKGGPRGLAGCEVSQLRPEGCGPSGRLAQIASWVRSEN